MELTGKTTGYSKNETKVFGILATAEKPVTTAEIADKVYGKGKERPFHARQTILGSLTSLQEKVKANKEAFTIKKGKRKGPHPIAFWIEEKKK